MSFDTPIRLRPMIRADRQISLSVFPGSPGAFLCLPEGGGAPERRRSPGAPLAKAPCPPKRWAGAPSGAPPAAILYDVTEQGRPMRSRASPLRAPGRVATALRRSRYATQGGTLIGHGRMTSHLGRGNDPTPAGATPRSAN